MYSWRPADLIEQGSRTTLVARAGPSVPPAMVEIVSGATVVVRAVPPAAVAPAGPAPARQAAQASAATVTPTMDPRRIRPCRVPRPAVISGPFACGRCSLDAWPAAAVVTRSGGNRPSGSRAGP